MWKKRIIGTLSRVFPSTFTDIAYDRLTNPQNHKSRAHERRVLEEAEQGELAFNRFRIRTYRWPGHGAPVLLIHGWEGQAGNFADIIDALRAQGREVIAFDAPAHGDSSRGKTSPMEFSELVVTMLRNTGVRQVISHSFGGVAISYALHENPDLALDRLVMITTPDRFSERIQEVAEQVGVSPLVISRLHARMAEQQIDVSRFNVSDFVKKVRVEKALIMHDKDDRVIPLSQSLNVHRNWPGSTFEVVEGTGHFRILRTPSVIRRLVEFVSDAPSS